MFAVSILCLLWASAPEQSPPAVRPAIAVTAPGDVQQLQLRDGTRAFGRVTTITGRLVHGEFRPADPNPTRLFFGPTGRSLRQGDGYVGVYEIMLPFVQVGLTDRITVGAGTPLMFGGGSGHPFWVTPKVQVFNSPSTQAAVGVLHFMNIGDGNLGIAYGVVTHGSADSAVTAGVGYAYDRTYDSHSGGAVVMIGGEHRVSRGVKLVTENYVWRDGGILVGGVRWLGENLSADFGLAAPIGAGTFVAFPMVNVVYRFSVK
jgi:predicted heme/steroid binding protein